MNALRSCERSGNTNPDPTGASSLPAGARFQRHVSVRTFYFTPLSSARNALKARELSAVADPPEVSTSSLTTRFPWLATCVSICWLQVARWSAPCSNKWRNACKAIKHDIHGSVHHNTNPIGMTNKMQLCRTIYYSIVPWLPNTFQVILSLIIRSF